MKKPLIIAIVVLALGAGAGFYFLARGREQQQIALRAAPSRPDLGNALPVLRERISEAEDRLARGSKPVEALAELSRLYHANGYLAEAEKCYQGLEQLQPNEARWPHLRATILAGYGDVEPALALWRRVLQLAPDYTPAGLRLGDVLLKLNRTQEAADAYQSVLRVHSDDSYAQLGLARIDWEAGRLNEARARLEQIVRQTNFALGYDLIVSVYEKLGETQRAAAIRGQGRASGAYRDPQDPWLDALMDDCYDVYRLALAGGATARNGDLDTGIRLLQRATQLAPEDVSSCFQLGGLYEQKNDRSAAIAQYRQCTKIAPDFPDGWARLSALLAAAGDNQGANAAVLAGLSHCPDSPGLHRMRARALKEAGQLDQAFAEYERSIQLRSNEADAYVEYASALISAGQTDRGVEQLKKSLEAEPENPDALSTLAFHAITTHDRARADEWMNRVARQPRVPREQAAQLLEVYRRTFGQEFQSRR